MEAHEVILPNSRPQKCVSCGTAVMAPPPRSGESGVTCSLACLHSYLECYPRPRMIRLFATLGLAYPFEGQVLPDL